MGMWRNDHMYTVYNRYWQTQISKIMRGFNFLAPPIDFFNPHVPPLEEKFYGVEALEGLVIGLENQLFCVFSAVCAQNCFWFNWLYKKKEYIGLIFSLNLTLEVV